MNKIKPFTREEIDEIYYALCNVATTAGQPSHPLWIKGAQRHAERIHQTKDKQL